jgi:hypothetical protein
MGGAGENNGIVGNFQGGWFKKGPPLFLLWFENQSSLTDSLLSSNKQRF